MNTKTLSIYAQMALAIADPTRPAMLIDEDNRRVRWLSAEDAVERDECFAVCPYESILAVDADSLEESLALCDIARAMEREGLLPVLVRSGQPNRAHMFVRIESRRFRERWVAKIGKACLDLRRGANGFIRPPGTKHRFLDVRSETVLDPELALARLQATPAPRASSRTLLTISVSLYICGLTLWSLRIHP